MITTESVRTSPFVLQSYISRTAEGRLYGVTSSNVGGNTHASLWWIGLALVASYILPFYFPEGV